MARKCPFQIGILSLEPTEIINNHRNSVSTTVGTVKVVTARVWNIYLRVLTVNRKSFGMKNVMQNQSKNSEHFSFCNRYQSQAFQQIIRSQKYLHRYNNLTISGLHDKCTLLHFHPYLSDQEPTIKRIKILFKQEELKEGACILFYLSQSQSQSQPQCFCNVYPVALDRTRR